MVARYKVNTQKSIILSCISNEQVKNTVSFTLALHKIKYLGTNLSKYIWDLLLKTTYEILINEIKVELNTWERFLVHR